MRRTKFKVFHEVFRSAVKSCSDRITFVSLSRKTFALRSTQGFKLAYDKTKGIFDSHLLKVCIFLSFFPRKKSRIKIFQKLQICSKICGTKDDQEFPRHSCCYLIRDITITVALIT